MDQTIEKPTLLKRIGAKNISLFLVFGGALFFAVRMAKNVHEIDVLGMTSNFLAGLAFFLHGMTIMEKSLDRLAGNKMKKTLETATKNRFRGMTTGIITTIFVGSSSITAVLLLNLVGTGALAFARSIPVILGSNIGSTLTIQLLSFNIDAIVPYLIVVGFFLLFLNEDKKWNAVGTAIFGLALLFFGLMFMKNAMVPLRTYVPFQDLMIHMSNPFFGMLTGLLFAGLIQSSAATMGVVVALAANGLIGIPAGIALSLGAHSGKCITLILASLGKIGRTVNARRTLVAIIFINVATSVAFLFFIPQLVWAVGLMGGSTARAIANADTLFNVLATIVLFPFTGWMALTLEKSIQPKAMGVGEMKESKYLRTEAEIRGPLGVYFGLAGVKQEMHRMGTIVLLMYKEVLSAMLYGTEDELDDIIERDKTVDVLYDKIFANILLIRQVGTTQEQLEILMKLERFADELERAGDTVKRLAHYGVERCEDNVEISEGTQKKIVQMHEHIQEHLVLMLEVISGVMSKEERIQSEEKIIKAREKIAKENLESIQYLSRPREEGELPFRIEAFKLERDLLRYMERFFKKIHRMATLHISHYSIGEEDEDRDIDGPTE